MSDRYADHVRVLLEDAAEHAGRLDWDGVRDLAGAALALEPANDEARRLLTQAEEASPAYGERRQITVMFCDVVGSTALSRHRDPEIVREVLRSYQAACDSVVRRYEGWIARFIGDGVLAYFGYPTAHEDDARRAVRAGLDLMEALQPAIDEARERYDIELAIRAAVHTGLVVRADMGTAATPDRDAIVGDAPNVAARLQDVARPGTLVISGATFDLVRGWFLVAPLGPVDLKGIDEPVEAFEVVAETPGTSRLQVQADLSPFVGRGAEVVTLLARWAEVVDGGSAAACITGEAGVGKSRLADVLRRRLQEADATALLTHCYSYHETTALYPVRHLIEAAAGIEPGIDDRTALSRLWMAMDAVGQGDALPYFADLLRIPPEPWCPPPSLDGALLREQLLTTLVRWVEASAEVAPVLLIVDDVQWADPTTLDLVGRVIRQQIPGLLLVLTARDDFTPPWTVERVELARLGPVELLELARRLPGGHQIDPPQLEQLIERSDGVPLFLEELVRGSTAPEGTGPIEVAADALPSIPPALQDLLLARFAVPGAQLTLAQAVATIGVAASRDVVAAACGLPPDELDRQLDALVDAGVLVAPADEPNVVRFRHQLLAELAYSTQLTGPRQRVHGLVADSMLTADSVDHGVVAHHLERAAREGEAIVELAAAADASQALGAFDEAGVLLDRGIALLDAAPADRRGEVEFLVRLRRGMNVAAQLGYAAPQAAEDLSIARDLVAELHPRGYLDEDEEWGNGTGVIGERLWSVAGLWASCMLQGQLDAADSVTQDVIDQLHPGGTMREYFETTRGFISFFRGDFTAAEQRLGRNIEIFDDMELPSVLPVPNDPRLTAWAHLAMAEAVRGKVEQSRRRFDAAMEGATKMPFPRGPFTLCYVAGMQAATEFMLRNVEEARTAADAQLVTAERHGYTFWLLVGSLHQANGDVVARVEGAEQRAMGMVGMMQATGLLVWLPALASSIGESLLIRGDPLEAEGPLSMAADLAAATGAHLWSAEIARTRGVAKLLVDDRDPDALVLLRDAVRIAEEQGATLFELRARLEVCRHADDPADREALGRFLERSDHLSPSLPELALAHALLAEQP